MEGTAADGDAGDAAATGDGAIPEPGTDAGGAADGSTAADSGGGGADLPTTTGFDEFAQSGNAPILCDATGTCFKSGSSISKLAPNGTSFTSIGSTGNGLASFQLPGLALDAQGTLYTNICSQGVFKLPAGQTAWTAVGTGLSGNTGTSCNNNTLAVDSAGTLFVGFPISAELWKLPSGQTAWANTASGLTGGGVMATITRGLDVFVAGGNGVKALLSGASAWVTHGTGNPGNANRIALDHAGNMYTNNAAGSDLADICKLPAGTTAWARTSGLNRGDVNSPRVTNVAFDNKRDARVDEGARSARRQRRLPEPGERQHRAPRHPVHREVVPHEAVKRGGSGADLEGVLPHAPMASFFSSRSLLFCAFALGAGCASSSSEAPSSPTGAGTGASPDGGAIATTAAPIAVALPPPDDRDLAAADQAHVVALAARPEGGVFAVVARRDGFGAFQPAGGLEGLATTSTLVAVDASGAVAWKHPVARGARVMAMPDGSAVVGDIAGFHQFDASGKLLRETPLDASVLGVGRLGTSTISGLVLLTDETAPRFGLAKQTLALVDAFGKKALAPSFGDADSSPLAIDGAGVGWSSSHRIAADGSVRRLGIPRWEKVTGRRDGGAWVTFTVASDGCGTPCEPEVAKRGEGAFRAQLDASGAIVAIDEDVFVEDLLAEHESVLWFANGRVKGATHALQVGPTGAWGSVSSTGHVAPGAIVSGKDGVWVGGGFTGRLHVLGTDLDAGTTQGTPFLVRIPGAASLADLGR